MISKQLLNRYTRTLINSQSSAVEVKQTERYKVDIRLHATLIAIGYSNYLSEVYMK